MLCFECAYSSTQQGKSWKDNFRAGAVITFQTPSEDKWCLHSSLDTNKPLKIYKENQAHNCRQSKFNNKISHYYNIYSSILHLLKGSISLRFSFHHKRKASILKATDASLTPRHYIGKHETFERRKLALWPYFPANINSKVLLRACIHLRVIFSVFIQTVSLGFGCSFSASLWHVVFLLLVPHKYA